MIEIDGVLISSEITSQKFVCNLNACKGACCWEGDFGAPVSDNEIDQINENLPLILNQLSDKSKEKIGKDGPLEYYEDEETWGTSLHDDGACVFLTKDELGISKCGIEESYNKGESTFKKPISCHLYPIRVINYEEQKFESWNYDEWDICSAACALGEELKVPVYQFLKDAITRYKGEEFYNRLDHAANHLDNDLKNEHK